MVTALFWFALSILTAMNARTADQRFKSGDLVQGTFSAALVVLGVVFICREII